MSTYIHYQDSEYARNGMCSIFPFTELLDEQYKLTQNI